MADNRKYYYLKLKENFFDSDSIVLLEDMKDGILYSNGAGRNSSVQNQDGKGTGNHQGRLHAGRTLCADSATET